MITIKNYDHPGRPDELPAPGKWVLVEGWGKYYIISLLTDTKEFAVWETDQHAESHKEWIIENRSGSFLRAIHCLTKLLHDQHEGDN